MKNRRNRAKKKTQYEIWTIWKFKITANDDYYYY
jgi:hypothetical protein